MMNEIKVIWKKSSHVKFFFEKFQMFLWYKHVNSVIYKTMLWMRVEIWFNSAVVKLLHNSIAPLQRQERNTQNISAAFKASNSLVGRARAEVANPK